jgi:hypothetical protein
MRSSNFLAGFSYQLRAYITAIGFPTMVFLHNGSVGGGETSRHSEDGFNALIPLYWDQFVAGSQFVAHKDYEWDGVLGTLRDVPMFIADILGFAVDVVAGGLGCVIGATLEAASALGIDFGPGGTLGVLAGVAVYAVSIGTGLPIGASLIMATVSGVAVGAVAEALIDTRRLSDDEITFARRVYGERIPYGDVRITNLEGAGGRAFTVPGADGKTYINIGSQFANPRGGTTGSNPVPGQLFIHEMAHAMQIAEGNFIPGYMCSSMINQANDSFGDSVYKYGDAGPAWGEFNFEQQASIIDDWFAGTRNSRDYRPMDQGSPYYRYLWADVLRKDIPLSAPGNLRSASGMAISQHEGKFDVYWPTPDARGQGTWWDIGFPWNSPIWVSDPGWTANAPIALATRINTLEIFWPTPDGSIAHTWWTTLGWGSPHVIAGPGSVTLTSANGFAQPVSVTLQTPNQMDIFGLTPDGSIITVWWRADTNEWGGPYNIVGPGSAAGAVTAISRKPGHMDVAWVSPDGSVMHSAWDYIRNSWTLPFPIAGPGSAVPTSLGMCCKMSEHIDVFWVTPDGSVGTNWWGNGAWSGAFLVAGPGSAAGGISALARTPEHVAIIYIGPDGSVGNAWWEPSDPGWRAPFTISGPGSASPGSAIKALARSPKLCDLFWIGSDGSIYSNWFDGSQWMGAFTLAGPGSAAIPPVPGATRPLGTTGGTDSDGDGMSDEDEILFHTDPASADSDGDLLSDGEERRIGTFATIPDSDGDGVRDGDEVLAGTDPLDAGSR